MHLPLHFGSGLQNCGEGRSFAGAKLLRLLGLGLWVGSGSLTTTSASRVGQSIDFRAASSMRIVPTSVT